MISIIKASSNNVCLTLTEKTTIANPIYLFSFTNPQSGDNKTFLSADISIYTDRYNEFVIIETSTNPDNLIGEVTLTLESYWNYEVYAQTSTTNLIVADAIELVEKGKVYVVPAVVTDTAPATSIYDIIPTFNG